MQSSRGRPIVFFPDDHGESQSASRSLLCHLEAPNSARLDRVGDPPFENLAFNPFGNDAICFPISDVRYRIPSLETEPGPIAPEVTQSAPTNSFENWAGMLISEICSQTALGLASVSISTTTPGPS